MGADNRSLWDSLSNFVESLSTQIRAAVSVTAEQVAASSMHRQQVDPDFQGWIRNDPMVVQDPSNRYGDDAPGYLTRNGLGSLEIGAAED